MITYSTCGLDFQTRRDLLEELNIAEAGSTRAKACGSLDVVSTCLINELCHNADLILSEKTSLNDNLEDRNISTGLLDLADLFTNTGIVTLLEPPDVNNHIDFEGAILYGLTGLEYLDLSGLVTEGEPNDSRNLDFGVLEENFGFLNKGGRNANCREIAGKCVDYNLSHIIPTGARLQHCLVDVVVDYDFFTIFFVFGSGMRTRGRRRATLGAT